MAHASVTPDAGTLALLVESVVDYAIFVLDPKGHIMTWSPGAERIKGYCADEIVGQHFSRFYTPEEIASGKPPHELEVAAKVGRFEDEGWRLRKDGSRFWANVIITALRDATGTLRGFAKVTRDLTERKAAEERARLLAAEQAARVASERLLAQAELANRAKDQFLAMLSHELRNPLAPIVTALELMKLDEHDVWRSEREVIERQVRHLTRLVEDLLDISRITQGKVSLHYERVVLDRVVKAAVELAEPLIEQRRHHLTLNVPPDLDVHGDPERLQQVVANLLINAAKYTPAEGQIAVRAARNAGEVVLEVTDNGEGLDPDLLSRIFDPFTQSSQSLDRQRGGLGLGLAIVRGLVEVHGGHVRAMSDGPGRGSTFTVRLPGAAPAERTAAPETHAASWRGAPRRILIVEDSADAATMLRRHLIALGHTVVVAPDGPRALDLAVKFAPEVALVDIGLPVMDGYELARRLRASPSVPSMYLVALTGYGHEGSRDLALAAGFDEHVIKPIGPDQIQRLLNRTEIPSRPSERA